MDWQAEMEDERRMLKRIVAFLFFFAWLARLSCALPQSARGYVLGVLRRAEARVHGFVAGMAQEHGLALPASLPASALHGGDSRAEAVRLTQSFRRLAILVGHIIEHYDAWCQTIGNAPFANGTSRAGSLLAKLCRSLVAMTGRQIRAAPMRPALEPIDSS